VIGPAACAPSSSSMASRLAESLKARSQRALRSAAAAPRRASKWDSAALGPVEIAQQGIDFTVVGPAPQSAWARGQPGQGVVLKRR